MQTNNILKNSILAGLFFIPFIAFYVSSSMLFPFITGKNFVFRIIVEILFALWAILALRDKDYLPKGSWVFYAAGIFLVTIAIGDFLGANPARSFWSNYERMEGLVAHIHLFLYFIVASTMLATKKSWNKFFASWIVASVVMSFYSLFQIAGKITINQGGARVDGTFGNAIYLAVFMMFSFFFTCLFILRSAQNKQKLWYLVPIAFLQLYVMYMTATRGVILGVIGGLAVVGAILILKEKENSGLRKSAIGIFVGLAVIVLGFIAIHKTSFVQNSPVLSRFASLSVSELETQGRYYIWPMAYKGFLENPIFGWGQENFGIIFSKYYNPKMYNQEQWFDRAHSGPIDWLVAGGLLAFISYLSLFAVAIWYLWNRNGFNLTFAEKSIIIGLIAAHFFQGIFVFDNLFSSIAFFSVLAFAHASSESKTLELPGWLSLPPARNALSVVVVFFFMFTLYFWNWKPIRASQSLILSLQSIQQGDVAGSLDNFDKVFSYNTFGSSEAREQLINNIGMYLADGVPEDLKVRYVNMADKQLQEQLKENPGDARSVVFYGTLLGNIGKVDQSIEEFKKAVELSPKKQTILFQLAGAYIANKDYKEAYEIFKKAYELEVTNQQAKILYGVGAIYVGDSATANELFQSVNPDTLLFDDRVVSALAATNNYENLVQIFLKRLETEQGRKNPQNFISLAISYVQIGQKAKAVEVLNQLVQINPGYKEQVDEYIKQIGG